MLSAESCEHNRAAGSLKGGETLGCYDDSRRSSNNASSSYSVLFLKPIVLFPELACRMR